MSQSPRKIINEGSFLYQITFIYHAGFLLKTQTPCRLRTQGWRAGEGQPVLGW